MPRIVWLIKYVASFRTEAIRLQISISSIYLGRVRVFHAQVTEYKPPQTFILDILLYDHVL